MQVFSTIIPIFAVVILGFFARRKGFMPEEFLGSANRLVYHLAIPALIFRSVARASLRTEFNAAVLLVTLAAVVLAYCGAWLVGRRMHWPSTRIGTFIQCSAHGNHGYVGLPIAFYFLGEAGLVKTSIIAGFMMILQNILSIVALQVYALEQDGPGINPRLVAGKLVHNPVIISALAGMAVSLCQIPLPQIVHRFLDILGNLAPPMALLLIGASLSLKAMEKNIVAVMGSVGIKTIGLPVIGLVLFRIFSVSAADYLPGLILLATPTATIAYIMSKEMHGDDQFAVAAISASTIFSAVTYLFWLTVVGLD